MKLERSKIELDLYGEIVSLRKPTFKEAKEYRDGLSKLDEKGDATMIIQAFMEKLGLPAQKFESLEMEHVQQILEVLLGAKKN